jgi:hypothetical protein
LHNQVAKITKHGTARLKKNLTQRLSAAEPQPKQNLTQRRKDAKRRQDGKIFQKANESLEWHCKDAKNNATGSFG